MLISETMLLSQGISLVMYPPQSQGPTVPTFPSPPHHPLIHRCKRVRILKNTFSISFHRSMPLHPKFSLKSILRGHSVNKSKKIFNYTQPTCHPVHLGFLKRGQKEKNREPTMRNHNVDPIKTLGTRT